MNLTPTHTPTRSNTIIRRSAAQKPKQEDSSLLMLLVPLLIVVALLVIAGTKTLFVSIPMGMLCFHWLGSLK